MFRSFKFWAIAGSAAGGILILALPVVKDETPPRFETPPAITAPMATVKRDGHDLVAGGKRFEVWGFNYGIGARYPILDYFKSPTPQIQRRVFNDMREARDLGANTLRIYLEVGSFMRSPDRTRPAALRSYRELLAKAERLHLYIDVTGGISWRPAPHWYDALGERDRWHTQAQFWRAVADAGHRSPAVLLYELTSEPQIVDSESWYGPEWAGYTFIQYIVRNIGGRDPQQLAFRWTRKMRTAVRSQDRRHLIGLGFLPVCGGPFAHQAMTDLLDVFLVHVYPRQNNGGEDTSFGVVCDFSEHRIPTVLGETAPLYTREWSRFLLDSRGYLDGYLYFYDGRAPDELTGDDLPEIYMRAALLEFLGLRRKLVDGNAK